MKVSGEQNLPVPPTFLLGGDMKVALLDNQLACWKD